METLTQIAHTAAQTVWPTGGTTEEPVSGVQGDVRQGEPFDGGNADLPVTNGGGDVDASHTATAHAPEASQDVGETVVRSTGLQADGGDFDAARPGAGREAERLVHEKGLRTTGSTLHEANKTATATDPADPTAAPTASATSTTTTTTSPPSTTTHNKKGLGQKLKEKVRGGQ